MSYLEDGFENVHYWNPLVGCTTCSPGCEHCFALGTVNMLAGKPGLSRYRSCIRRTKARLQWSGRILFLEDRLAIPARRRRPTFWYTCSLSDLFHPAVSQRQITRVLDVMAATTQHRFQVITKRIERAVELNSTMRWPRNLVLGVSVENADWLSRMDALKGIRVRTKFVCFEPLLESLPGADLAGIDGVVVGGEYGPGYRPMDLDWVRAIRDTCQKTGVPFFFSHRGGASKRRSGRKLDGRTWTELPHGLWDTTDETNEVNAIPRVPGSYVLVLALAEARRIRVGALGLLDFHPGTYIYCGSAHGPGGLGARIARHCRRRKAKRWHIDFLRAHMRLVGALWVACPDRNREHEMAHVLGEEYEPYVPGLGATDCRCPTHVFCSSDAPADVLSRLRKLLRPGVRPSIETESRDAPLSP